MVAVGDDRWDVLIGGAAGASVRRGDVLATVDGHDEVVRLCGVFMQYYRENAKWLERSYDFVPRVGLDELKAILVDDRDGLVAGLEEHRSGPRFYGAVFEGEHEAEAKEIRRIGHGFGHRRPDLNGLLPHCAAVREFPG